jgi:hypothetical protein
LSQQQNSREVEALTFLIMEDSEEETHPVVEVDAEKGAVEVDAEKGATDKGPKKKAELLRKHTSMQSSVLRFKNIDFAVGSNDNKKLILDDVSGTVKWGRVLAVCCSFKRDVSMC